MTQPSQSTRRRQASLKKSDESVQKPTPRPSLAKTTTPKKTSKTEKPESRTHPKFLDMVTEAIQKLNEKNGSSRQAILKYIIATFPVDEKSANQYLKVTLKNGVKAGQLKQLRGVGASGSFKIAEKGAKPEKTSAKKDVSKTEKKTTNKKAPAKAKAAPKRKPKTVTKEAAKAELPSAAPKARKPPTERQPVVAKKTRGRKPSVKSTEPSTPPKAEKAPSQTAVAAAESTKTEQKQTPAKGRKGKVSTKQAAEAKSKKATRGRKKEVDAASNETAKV